MSKFTEFLKWLFGGQTSNEVAPVVQGGAPTQSVIADEEALEFFNALSGTLEIELSEPAQPVGGLENVAASPEAKMVSARLNVEVYEEGLEEGRPLTEAELGMVVIEESPIHLRGESGGVIAHRAPDGTKFTVRDLLRAVEETERQTRESTEWLGGVDVHHCFFEGIHQGGDGVWEIVWGS